MQQNETIVLGGYLTDKYLLFSLNLYSTSHMPFMRSYCKYSSSTYVKYNVIQF